MRSTFHHEQVGVKGPRRRLVNALKAQLFKRAIKSVGMKTLLTIDPTLLQWYARPNREKGREHAAEQALEHARVREGSEGVHGRSTYLADPFPDRESDRSGFG